MKEQSKKMNMWLPISVLICAGLLSANGFVLDDTDIETPLAKDFKKILHDYAGNEVVKYAGARTPYFPCPVPADILPCICTPDSAHVTMDMDCSAVTTNEELIAAFNATMPFYLYRLLKIVPAQPSPQLTVLNSLSFGQAYFENVHISRTAITEIQDGTFDNSHLFLKILVLSNNKINTFPFESITEYMRLRTVNLNNNKILVAEKVRSKKLQKLELRQNEGISFGSGLFVSAPALQFLDISRCGIQQLTGNMFEVLHSLKTLRLGTNKLTALETSAIAPPADTLETIHLNGNNISDVKEGAITGFAPTAEIFFENNQITELPELVWKPLAERLKFEALKLSGNPLHCDCGMQWMYQNDTNYYLTFERITTCSDSYPIYSIPPELFETFC